MDNFISLDLPALLAAIFASMSCALLGNYLVLRRLSLMGDAISHSVLPGIVIAFLVASSRDSMTVFIGAAVAGGLSAILIELIRRFGRVETGASMGVVFSIFFAAGVVLMEQAAARAVDLDADCLLHGQLESIFWFPPSKLFSLETISLFPQEVYESFFTLCLIGLFVALFYKELLITSFDPALATSVGFSSSLIYQLLMILVACAVVASFKIVGSILVIAMLIAPPASARLYTDKLKVQIVLSLIFAFLASVLGYFFAAFTLSIFGYNSSLNAAGMMAVSSGIIFFVSTFFAPKYGVVSKEIRRRNLANKVRQDDILALLYRIEEGEGSSTVDQIVQSFGASRLTSSALSELKKNGLILIQDVQISLTSNGAKNAAKIIRSHRLWETYLVNQAGMSADHVHNPAEALEHFDPPQIEDQIDPHGKKIPE